MTKRTLNAFLKYSRNNNRLFLNDTELTYSEYKRDFRNTSLANANVLSWDACEMADGTTDVAISLDRDTIDLYSRKAEEINKRLDALNEIIGSQDTKRIEKLVKAVERLLPCRAWLNFDGCGYWVIRYRSHGREYYNEVNLIQA